MFDPRLHGLLATLERFTVDAVQGARAREEKDRDPPRLLHTAVSGDGLYKAVLEPKFDLTLARMASERSLRTFVVWPPVVHLQRDDDDTPTDGYGGNSSRFIEAYLGMDER